MGLFNFVKEAGEKLWDAVTGADDPSKKLRIILINSAYRTAIKSKSMCKATPLP